MTSQSTPPTPSHIKGGCLCGALRYEVDFPPNHDFKSAFSTCQCTQCRKQTSSFFLTTHTIKPASHFRFTTPTTTLKNFEATPSAQRGFCTNCGSLIYWKPKPNPKGDGTAPEDEYVSLTVGTIDPLYLFGEGADGTEVPDGGYGRVLAAGEGNHWWTGNEIRGVTDDIPVAGCGRGRKWKGDE